MSKKRSNETDVSGAKSKKQVIVIGGGETFDTYEEYIDFLKDYQVDLVSFDQKNWKDSLQDLLGEEFEIIRIKMPNKMNAKYLEWKIWFEKHIPFLKDGVFFVGHSLGGMFLVKYLQENDFPKKIKALFLVAPPYDDKDSLYSLSDFKLQNDFEHVEKQVKNIFLYHSRDDSIVPFADLEKFKRSLPSAMARELEGRDHFLTDEFPEIVSDLKELK